VFSPPGGAAAQVASNYDFIADGYSARTNFTDAAGNAVNVKWLSPYKVHSLYVTHPEYFVLGTAQQAAQYTSKVTTSKRHGIFFQQPKCGLGAGVAFWLDKIGPTDSARMG